MRGWTAPPDVARSGLFVSSAHFDRDRDGLRVLRIRVILLAPPAFLIFLQSVSWPPLSSAVSGRLRRSSACCSGRISCPRKAKLGGADGALREDHIIYFARVRSRIRMRWGL